MVQGAVKSVIGTTAAIDVEDARRLTVAFYRPHGGGLSVREAFRDGGEAVFQRGGKLDLVLVGESESL